MATHTLGTILMARERQYRVVSVQGQCGPGAVGPFLALWSDTWLKNHFRVKAQEDRRGLQQHGAIVPETGHPETGYSPVQS